jgi:hypothetical protein
MSLNDFSFSIFVSIETKFYLNFFSLGNKNQQVNDIPLTVDFMWPATNVLVSIKMKIFWTFFLNKSHLRTLVKRELSKSKFQNLEHLLDNICCNRFHEDGSILKSLLVLGVQ